MRGVFARGPHKQDNSATPQPEGPKPLFTVVGSRVFISYHGSVEYGLDFGEIDLVVAEVQSALGGVLSDHATNCRCRMSACQCGRRAAGHGALIGIGGLRADQQQGRFPAGPGPGSRVVHVPASPAAILASEFSPVRFWPWPSFTGPSRPCLCPSFPACLDRYSGIPMGARARCFPTGT
jgi:hypothetical protein